MESESSKSTIVPVFSYSNLEFVDENVDPQKIVVRLVHTWEARDFKRCNVFMSQDCLFLGAKDIAIQASIHPRRLHKYKNKLREGKIFVITSFDVKKNPNFYRLTDHEYKIYFNEHTVMDVVEDGEGDQYKIPDEYYRILPYRDIEMLLDKGQNLPDIVAQVTCIRTCDKVDDTKIPPKNTFNVTLTCVFDSGEIGYVSVWEKPARQVLDELEEIKGKPVVVIVTGVNLKTLFGKTYLNATASTRFLFNVENLITEAFRKSLSFEESLVPINVDASKENVPRDIHSIEQILAFVNEQGGEEKSFWCKAKVVDVLLGNGWFFISCGGCKLKMSRNGGLLTCATCPPKKAVGLLRYRIELVVEDDSQSSTFVLFDQAAKKILKATASDLAAKNDVSHEDDSGYIAPKVIQDIVGSIYMFEVKVTEYNYTARHQSFRVTDIAKPSTIETTKPTTVGTKKRCKTNESTSNNSSAFGTKDLKNKKVVTKSDSDTESPTIKKRRSLRKNKGQIVIEEFEEEDETTINAHCDKKLEDDD